MPWRPAARSSSHKARRPFFGQCDSLTIGPSPDSVPRAGGWAKDERRGGQTATPRVNQLRSLGPAPHR